jgi:hypothetical protein
VTEQEARVEGRRAAFRRLPRWTLLRNALISSGVLSAALAAYDAVINSMGVI